MSREDVICKIQYTVDGKSRSKETAKNSFIIGRGDEADVIIKISSISRLHLAVEVTEGEIWIKDLDTSNGTRLNGRSLPPQQAVPYQIGDLLHLGLSKEPLTLQLTSPEKTERSQVNQLSKIEIPPPPVNLQEKFIEPKLNISELNLEFESPVVKAVPTRHNSVISHDSSVSQHSAIIDKSKFTERPEKTEHSIHDHGRSQASLVINPAGPVTQAQIASDHGVSVPSNHIPATQKQILEEAKAAALEIKITAETEAAKITQAAKDRAFETVTIAREEAEHIVEEAERQAEALKKEKDAAAAEDRKAMQQAMAQVQAEFEHTVETKRREAREKGEQLIAEYNARAEKIVSEARVVATTTKADAQKEADSLLGQAYQKILEARSNWELELKNSKKDEEDRTVEIIAAAQAESDKILAEARAASSTIRKNFAQELEAVRDQAELEANAVRQEARNEASDMLEKHRAKMETERLETEQLRSWAEDEAGKIKAEAKKHAENAAARIREHAKNQKQELLKRASDDAQEIRDEATKAAQKEALAILKAEEGKRADLTHALENLKQEIAQHEQKRTEIAQHNRTLQKRSDDLKDELDSVATRVADSQLAAQRKTADFESKITATEELLKVKAAELANLKLESQKVIDSAAKAEATLKNFSSEKEKLAKGIESLHQEERQVKKSLEQLHVQIETEKQHHRANVTKEVQVLKDEAMAEVKRLREKAQSDYEHKLADQDAELARIKMTEIQNINSLRAQDEVRFREARRIQVLEISKSLESYLVPKIREALQTRDLPPSLTDFFNQLKLVVEKVFIAEYDGDAAQVQSSTGTLTRPRSQNNKVNAMIGIGVGLGVAIIAFLFSTKDNSVRKPASEVFLDHIKQKQAQRPQFTPQITDDYKATYTDNVIFTRDYANFKSNSDIQAVWIRDLNKFFVNDLNLNENSIVKFISVESTLVSQLKDLRATIHFETQKDDISKMVEAEKAAHTDMIAILGSEKNYRAFRDFERGYFIRTRKPASTN